MENKVVIKNTDIAETLDKTDHIIRQEYLKWVTKKSKKLRGSHQERVKCMKCKAVIHMGPIVSHGTWVQAIFDWPLACICGSRKFKRTFTRWE